MPCLRVKGILVPAATVIGDACAEVGVGCWVAGVTRGVSCGCASWARHNTGPNAITAANKVSLRVMGPPRQGIWRHCLKRGSRFKVAPAEEFCRQPRLCQ